MKRRVLVSTTSFLDTPGSHMDRLRETGYDIETARGPLRAGQLLELIGDGNKFDAFLCGEDEFDATVLKAAMPRVKVISRYGVGLEKIDCATAEQLGIVIKSTLGVNHSTVAELTFGLLIGLVRKICDENNYVHRGEWRRLTGFELAGKTLGILGFGRVGKEVAKRAMTFGMHVLVYNSSWNNAHLEYIADLNRVFSDPIFGEYAPSIKPADSDENVIRSSDIISLHMNITRDNTRFFNRRRLGWCKRGAFIVNVSRGALMDQEALSSAIRSGQIAGYAADVLDPEPVTSDNPLIGLSNVYLTPHVGSRTFESVMRQGMAAVTAITDVLDGSIGIQKSA